METRRLDLASLTSVREFAVAVIDALWGDSIDTLVLNAGGQRPDLAAITAGMRAYSASKLCNLMTARALAMRRPDLVVIAYDPGLTPGTGLVRSQHWAVRTLVWPLLPLIIPFGKSISGLADAGNGLADLATDATPPTGHVYASLRKGRMTGPNPRHWRGTIWRWWRCGRTARFWRESNDRLLRMIFNS